MSFPIYDTLFQECKEFKESDLSLDQMKKTVENIKKLDQEGQDNLYLIIRHSANLSKDTSVYGLKYSSKCSVVFDFENIPSLLQKIISLYVQKHITQMNNSKQLTNIVFE